MREAWKASLPSLMRPLFRPPIDRRVTTRYLVRAPESFYCALPGIESTLTSPLYTNFWIRLPSSTSET